MTTINGEHSPLLDGKPVKRLPPYASTSQVVIGCLGILTFIVLSFVYPLAGDWKVSRAAGSVSMIAFFWISELIEIGVASMLPIALFPLLNLANVKDIASLYFSATAFLFVGGYTLAMGLQRWNLHKRISLFAVKAVGGKPVLVTITVSFICFILSAFMSNTATCLSVLPNAVIILKTLDPTGKDDVITKKYGKLLLLVVAWSCSIGGTLTLIGSATNLSLGIVLEKSFPKIPREVIPDFATWTSFALPYAFILFIGLNFSFLSASRAAQKSMVVDEKTCAEEGRKEESNQIDGFGKQLAELGPMSFEEKVIAIAFSITAVLWATRTSYFGFGKGWQSFLTHPELFNDAVPAIIVCLILFFIPAKKQPPSGTEDKYVRIINWGTVKTIPLDLVFLFGCGLAMSEVFESSGLSNFMAEKLKLFENLPLPVLIYCICQLTSFISEVCSNTSTSLTLLPIVASLSKSIGVHPLYLMVPATLSCSNSYMLISATPPNSIVFASRHVVGLQVSDMAKRGIWLSILGNLALTVYSYFFLPFFYGFDPNVVPDWAH
ncbi:hypothetical protein RCL1_006958 [Eukaryota sp. TZLM3-RCL]